MCTSSIRWSNPYQTLLRAPTDCNRNGRVFITSVIVAGSLQALGREGAGHLAWGRIWILGRGVQGSMNDVFLGWVLGNYDMCVSPLPFLLQIQVQTPQKVPKVLQIVMTQSFQDASRQQRSASSSLLPEPKITEAAFQTNNVGSVLLPKTNSLSFEAVILSYLHTHLPSWTEGDRGFRSSMVFLLWNLLTCS